MNLSKSKYTRGYQCLKMLWLDENHPEEAKEIDNSQVFDTGHEVGELAKNLFGEYTDIEFNKDLNKMISDTKKSLDKGNKVITEASFKYENNFCSVDILINNKDSVEVYEVKSSTSLHSIYLEDISYQVYILKSLGYNVVKSCVVYLNNKYKYKDKLDIKKLFVIDDVTDYILSNQDNIKKHLDEINKLTDKEPKIDIGIQCMNPYECPYFEYCTKSLERPNIFDIKRLNFKKKLEYYKDNIITFKDIIDNEIDDRSIEQAEHELYKNISDKIEKDKIKSFLDTLSYPLYFLDFETYQDAIPKFNGTTPYEQIPFQYSLHIMDEKGNVIHKEFLADGINDPRRSLAENLIKDIPDNVCVLAYNMSFEKGVIKRLSDNYKDLSNHLLKIRDNIKDLMIPFYNRNYYTRDMKGSYSIKYVLPALFPDDPSLNYANLPLIHKGDQASNAYKNLINQTKEEQKETRNGLLVYCELDTYAMVKIYQKLKEIL